MKAVGGVKLLCLALTLNCFVLVPHFLLNQPVQPCLNDVLLHRIVVAHGAAHTHFGLGGGAGNTSTIAAVDAAAAAVAPWSFDHWLPHVGIGFPLLAHYQHVPHLLAMAAVRVTQVARHALWPAALPKPHTAPPSVTTEASGHAVVLDAMSFALLAIVSPVTLYSALRTLFAEGTGTGAALVAMALPAVSDAPPPQQRQQADRFEYGLGWGHAMRGGHGLWSQTLAAALLWPALALGIGAVGSSDRKTAPHSRCWQWRLQLRRELLAGVVVGLCVLSNMFVGVVAAASIALFAITPAPTVCSSANGDCGSALLPSLMVRMRRLFSIACFALITSSYWLVPFIEAGAAGAVWPLEPRPWKVHGVGARAVLTDAFRGRLLDHREGDVHAHGNSLGFGQEFVLSLAALPVITGASAAGACVAAWNLLRRQRVVDARRAHLDLWLLSGIVLWSVAYAGRPLFEWAAGILFGPAAPSVLRRWWDTVPLLGQLHLHRLVLGVQAFGLMLAARSVEALLIWSEKLQVAQSEQQLRTKRKRTSLVLVVVLVLMLCPGLMWRWHISRAHAAQSQQKASDAARDSWIAKSLVAIIRHRHAALDGRAGVGRVFAGTRAAVEEGSWFAGHGMHAALQEAGAMPSTAASVEFARAAAQERGSYPASAARIDNFTALPVPVLVPGALLHGLSPAAAVLNSFDWRRADHLRLFNVRYVVAPRNHNNTSPEAQLQQQSLTTAVEDGWLRDLHLPPALSKSVRLLELDMGAKLFRVVQCDDEASGNFSDPVGMNGAGYFMLGAVSPIPRRAFSSAALMRRSAAAEGQIGAGQLAVKAQVAWRRTLRWAGDFGTWVVAGAGTSGTSTSGLEHGALRKWAAARARFGLGLEQKQPAACQSTCLASAQDHDGLGHDVCQDVIATASMEAAAAAAAAALIVGGALDEHGVAWDGATKQDTRAAYPCSKVEGEKAHLEEIEAPAMLAPSQLLELSESWLAGMGPLAAHFVRYVPPASGLSLAVGHHSATFCQEPPLPPPPLPSCLFPSLLTEQEAASANVARARQLAALEHHRAAERETARQVAASGGSALSHSSKDGCMLSHGDVLLECAVADFSTPLKALPTTLKLVLRVPSTATKSAEREADTTPHVWQGCEKYKIMESRLPFALLVRRGGCSFDQKARVALAMGAHAMIVVNSQSGDGVGEPIPMGGSLGASPLQCNVSAGITFAGAVDVMAVPLASQPASVTGPDECCRACINAAAVAAADGGNDGSSCNVWTILQGMCYLKHQPVGTVVEHTACDECTSGQVRAGEAAPESPALTAVMVSALDGNDLISSALQSGVQVAVRIGYNDTKEGTTNGEFDDEDDPGRTHGKAHSHASAPVLSSRQAATASIHARGTVRAQWATPSASAFGCTVHGASAAESEADLVLKQAYHPGWRCWRLATMSVPALSQPLSVRAVLPGFVAVRIKLPPDTDVHVTCSYVPDEKKWPLLLWSMATLAICAAFTSRVV